MNRIGKGMIAGFVATFALSAMLLAKSAMGLVPQLDMIGLVAAMIGAPESRVLGWVGHFAIGTALWGAVFASIADRLPGGAWMRGLAFGVLAWLVMMIVVMPMAGAGLFGLRLGIGAPLITLMGHLLFGAVLGWVYFRSDTIEPVRVGQRGAPGA